VVGARTKTLWQWQGYDFETKRARNPGGADSPGFSQEAALRRATFLLSRDLLPSQQMHGRPVGIGLCRRRINTRALLKLVKEPTIDECGPTHTVGMWSF
jgi:hypothetical protein